MPVATINIALPTVLNNAALVDKLGASSVDKHKFVANVINVLQALASGAQDGAISYSLNPSTQVTQTSVTLTFDNAAFVDNDLVSIGVLDFRCVATGPAGQNEYVVGASSALTAQSFVDAFNTNVAPYAGGWFSVSRVDNVVTVTSKQLGLNLYRIVSENELFVLPSSDAFGNFTPDTSVEPPANAVFNFGQGTDAP